MLDGSSSFPRHPDVPTHINNIPIDDFMRRAQIDPRIFEIRVYNPSKNMTYRTDHTYVSPEAYKTSDVADPNHLYNQLKKNPFPGRGLNYNLTTGKLVLYVPAQSPDNKGVDTPGETVRLLQQQVHALKSIVTDPTVQTQLEQVRRIYSDNIRTGQLQHDKYVTITPIANKNKLESAAAWLDKTAHIAQFPLDEPGIAAHEIAHLSKQQNALRKRAEDMFKNKIDEELIKKIGMNVEAAKKERDVLTKRLRNASLEERPNIEKKLTKLNNHVTNALTAVATVTYPYKFDADRTCEIFSDYAAVDAGYGKSYKETLPTLRSNKVLEGVPDPHGTTAERLKRVDLYQRAVDMANMKKAVHPTPPSYNTSSPRVSAPHISTTVHEMGTRLRGGTIPK